MSNQSKSRPNLSFPHHHQYVCAIRDGQEKLSKKFQLKMIIDHDAAWQGEDACVRAGDTSVSQSIPPPGRQQLPALAAVPAGELVVTAQLPFAAAPLPAAAPLLQIGRQLCTQTPPLRPPKCDQTPRNEPHLILSKVCR